MSSYKVPDSVFKRLSITTLDHGLLHNLIRRIIPMIGVIIFIIAVCIVPAYSLSGRAIPRQLVVGIYITTAILIVLWVTLYSISYCRAKCAGKHNLRLEPPTVEPEPVPKAPTAGWDSIGPGYFPDRAKQVPAVARRGRGSTSFGDICDKVKDWLDGGCRHHKGNVREKAPAHVSRGRDRSRSRHAPHNQHDARRDDTTGSEAEDLYQCQRDRNSRGDRGDAQRAHQSYHEGDENRSQDFDSMEVHPPRAVLRHDVHHYYHSHR